MIKTKNIERSYQLAKDRYTELGVATDSALNELKSIPISLHCWQGDDVAALKFWRNAGRRTRRHRQLSRQGADAGGIARRFGKGLFAHSGQASPESPCLLWRVRRQKSGPRRDRTGTFRKLGCLGARTRTGTGFQPDVLFTSESGRRLYLESSLTSASENSGSNIASPADTSARRWATRSINPV